MNHVVIPTNVQFLTALQHEIFYHAIHLVNFEHKYCLSLFEGPVIMLCYVANSEVECEKLTTGIFGNHRLLRHVVGHDDPISFPYPC